MQTAEDLMQAVRDLVAQMKREPDSLWDTDDIAGYAKLSRRTVQNHIVGKEGFPRPIVLPTGGRRWLAGEVREWLLRHKTK